LAIKSVRRFLIFSQQIGTSSHRAGEFDEKSRDFFDFFLAVGDLMD